MRAPVPWQALAARFTFEWARELPPPLGALTALTSKPFAASALAFRQWLFSVFGEGIETAAQHAAVQREYLRLLAVLQAAAARPSTHTRHRQCVPFASAHQATVCACAQAILERQPFVGGARPSLADFGLAGLATVT